MRSLFLAITILFSTLVFSQATVNVSVKVLNRKGALYSNALVALIESSTNQKVEKRCASNGEVKLVLTEGKLWKLYVEGSEMRNSVEMPESGEHFRSMTVTYNPELDKRLSAQSNDRNGFTTTTQDFNKSSAPEAGKSLLKVKVQTREGKTFKDKRVSIVNLKKKEIYTNTSDASGIAAFMVEPGQHYDVDVESSLNIAFVDIRNKPGMLITIKAFYEEGAAEQMVFGDTIVQTVKSDKPASGHAFYILAVSKDGSPSIANESVYLAEIHGTKVYMAYTNQNGEARFLLPLGKKYMVHFNFQMDVDAIDLTKSHGFVKGRAEIVYRPDPKLEFPELYIPSRGELFLVDFENFLTKQYPKPKKPSKLAVYLKWANKINADSKEALLEIGYTASSQGAQKPNNISFVIDNSGSMSGYYRIERLKEAMLELVDQLKVGDKISIITFESEMKVVFDHQLLGTDRSNLKEAIKTIESQGGTNMLEALKTGYEMVNKNLIQNGNNLVIVMSDGYDENSAEDLMAVQKPYDNKIDCSTVGIGNDYNYSLLTLLAGNGKGTHVFVGEAEEFLSSFKKNMESLFSPALSDVKLEVLYNDILVFKHLYGKEPIASKKGSTQYQIPNLYEGTNNIALAKFDLIKPNKDIEKHSVTIRFTYADPVTGKTGVEEFKTYPEWEEYTGKYEVAVDFEVKKLYAIAEINRALKLMSEYYSDDNSKAAAEVLEETRAEMHRLFPNTDDKDLSALIRSMNQYLEVFRNLARKKKIGKGLK